METAAANMRDEKKGCRTMKMVVLGLSLCHKCIVARMEEVESRKQRGHQDEGDSIRSRHTGSNKGQQNPLMSVSP